jgi:hypothetical protein
MALPFSCSGSKVVATTPTRAMDEPHPAVQPCSASEPAGSRHQLYAQVVVAGRGAVLDTVSRQVTHVVVGKVCCVGLVGVIPSAASSSPSSGFRRPPRR